MPGVRGSMPASRSSVSRQSRHGVYRRHSTLGVVLATVLAGVIASVTRMHFGFVSPLVSSSATGRVIGSARRTQLDTTGGRRGLNLLARRQVSFKIGDLVTAISPEDNVRYPGTVAKLNDDGTVEVKWDDPDGGAESHPCAAKSVKDNRPKTAADFKVGDTVMAVSPEDEQTYPGVVGAINKDGTVQVNWDDPDGGPESHACKPETMEVYIPKTPLDQLVVGSQVKGVVKGVRDFGVFVDINAEKDGLVHISKIPKPPVKTGAFAVNDKVEAVFPEDKEWYTAVVQKAGKGSCEVKWDDPDGGPEVSEVKLDEMKHFAPKIGVEEEDEVEVWIEKVTEDGKLQFSMLPPVDYSVFSSLHPDEWLKGTIEGVAKFGFFVRVEHPNGASAPGLVHVSQIKDGFVDDPWAEGEEGQEIQVRVQSVDEVNKKMSLSMVNPGQGGGGGAPRPRADLTKFAEIPRDQWCKGVVARTAPFGAFVNVAHPDGSGETADGLLHITRIREGFVENVEAELSPGQEVDVLIQDVDLNSNKMSLSMFDGAGGGGGAPREAVDLGPFANFPSDQWIKGKVVKVAAFGAFVSVTLPDGATGSGLVHITAIKDGFVESVENELSIGQEVDVLIKDVDLNGGKMSLTMVDGSGGGGGGGSREPVNLEPFANFPSDQWIKGQVVKTAAFGAFVSVTLPDGATGSGLVHITAIKDGFVESVENELSIGQEVDVLIKEVDLNAGKMSLTMVDGSGGGGGSREPVNLQPFADFPTDQWLKGTVARTAAFGAFVKVTLPTGETADGLVHITNIKDGFVESVENELSEGQEVDVWIKEVDMAAGKMGLSMVQAGGSEE